MKNLIFIAVIFLIAAPALAQDFSAPIQKTASPVLVELFSSENCPACPPADEYMKSLSQSDGVIALSCHVDYFGRTQAGLGKKFCTERQSRYIRQIGRRSHYTPQMMVNGHMDVIGYETDKVSAKIVKGRSERVSKITIRAQGEGVYDFSIPARDFEGRADLWMAVYEKPRSVSERGRTTTYYNVVNNYMSLGQWSGGAVNRAVFPIVNAQSAGFTIVAQDKQSGEVLAAGEVKF